MSEFFSYLFAALVIAPLQAEVSEQLNLARSAEMVDAGRTCIAVAVPQLLDEAQQNWGWAIGTAIAVGVGLQAPASLLENRDPSCDRIAALLGNGEEQAAGEDGEA